jgi:two-component system cell cycle response regulator DivK
MDRDPAAPLSVLLVQPEGDSLELYSEYLAALGHTCIPATNVTDALAAASAADVVVTGILLPGSADGIELVTALRANRSTRRVPIIVLTACAFEAERRRAEAAGCDAFLAKPCLPSELHDEIRRVTARSSISRVRGSAMKVRETKTRSGRKKAANGNR